MKRNTTSSMGMDSEDTAAKFNEWSCLSIQNDDAI
jgi:hypothetical protein